MRTVTLSALDDYYTHLFSVDRAALWRTVTVRTHGEQLEGYEGCYAAWRRGGIHVSVPSDWSSSVHRAVSTEPLGTLQTPGFWRDLAVRRGLRLIGPSTHAYLDVDPGPGDGVERVTRDGVSSLRGLVDEADWRESGWNDQPPHMFGLYETDVLVAASNLNRFHHQPRDVGVVVAKGWRGRGLSEAVGRHAASFAIREHGFARWGARHTNAASLATSRRLGFEPWCVQVAVR